MLHLLPIIVLVYALYQLAIAYRIINEVTSHKTDPPADG